jgi:hypothetical protein
MRFDMNDPAIRLKFEVLTREVESMPIAIRPLITDLAARPGVTAADGHRSTFRTEQPFLDWFRSIMGAVHGFGGWRSPGHNQVGVTFCLQSQLAHRFSPLLSSHLRFIFIFGCSTPARTLSSRS